MVVGAAPIGGDDPRRHGFLERLRYASLFAGSPEGGHRWATIFGVVRTAQKCGVDVQAYLTWVFDRRGTHRKQFGLPASALTPMAYREHHEQHLLATG